MSPLPVSQNQCQLYLKRSSVERAHGRRSQEQIPVHAGRRGLVLGVPDGIAALEAQSLRLIDLADEALLHGGDGLHLERRAAMLRADLHRCFPVARCTSTILMPS